MRTQLLFGQQSKPWSGRGRCAAARPEQRREVGDYLHLLAELRQAKTSCRRPRTCCARLLKLIAMRCPWTV